MARARIPTILIALCLIISVTVGFPLIRATMRTVRTVMNRHYPGSNFMTALRGYYNGRYAHKTLVKKYQRKCRMISKDEDGFQLWDTPDGQYWMPAGTEQNYWVSWHLSEMDRKIYTKGKQKIRPGDIVIDCGAHVGFFTRYAIKAGANLVVAIEIAPANLVCLKRNLSTEIASGQVIVYEKGVWDRDDDLSLSLSDNSASDSLVIPREQGKIKVPLTTLDKIVKELGLNRVDMVKMDIEGSEQKALKGAIKTIQQFKPRLSIAVYHLENDLYAIPALMRRVRRNYKVKCGPIFESRNGQILPDILYFR